MTALPVLKLGEKSLQEPSVEVTEFGHKKLGKIIEDLHDTLKKNGGVGVAAPQVGINLRIILAGFEDNRRYPEEMPIPLTVLINLEFKPISEKIVDGFEGCMSVPGLRGKVPRYHKIHYIAKDIEGKIIEGDAEGFYARIIQHEYDHLEGISFIERIVDMKSLGFEDIIAKNFGIQQQKDCTEMSQEIS